MATSWDNDEMTPFEKLRVFNIRADERKLEESVRHMEEEFQNMAGAKVTKKWGSYIDATPDSVPINDEVYAISVLFIYNDFSCLSFVIYTSVTTLTALS